MLDLTTQRRPATVWHRILRALAVVVLMTAATAAISASPAAAVPGGCSGNYPVSACIDWGYYNNQARADFYLNASPDSANYSYKVYIVVNGSSSLKGSGLLDHSGRYCCWFRQTGPNLPAQKYTVYTRVDVYTSWGDLHVQAYSPTITYYN